MEDREERKKRGNRIKHENQYITAKNAHRTHIKSIMHAVEATYFLLYSLMILYKYTWQNLYWNIGVSLWFYNDMHIWMWGIAIQNCYSLSLSLLRHFCISCSICTLSFNISNCQADFTQTHILGNAYLFGRMSFDHVELCVTR